jgi:hypothetical protein
MEYYDGFNWVSIVSVGPTPSPNPTIGFDLAVDGTAVKVSIPTVSPSPAVGTLPTEAMDGSLYWDNTLGLLFIRYNDGTSAQWVQGIPSENPGVPGGSLVFPTVAQAAAQTPINTFSPTSSPLVNTSNSYTYVYDSVIGVWTCAGSGGGGGGGTVTSVGILGTQGIQVVSGSPVTSAGNITLSINVAALPPIP